jgi:hypothetical protein
MRSELVNMFIVNSELKKDEIINICTVKMDDNMIKGVVDLGTERIALDAAMHIDLESLFLDSGANQSELWGFNLYPDEDEDFIEFDSMINIRPWQNNRTRGVDDVDIQARIKEVIYKWIK